MRYLIRTLAQLALLFFATGCLPTGLYNTSSTEIPASPTMNPAFHAASIATLTPAGVGPGRPDTPSPPAGLTGGQSAQAAIGPSPTPVEYRRVVIYDERLDENWTLEHSNQVNFDMEDRSAAHNGIYALSFTPMASFSSLLWAVKQGAEQSYPRDQVVGVSFWLYSGDGYVKTSDLAVSVFGSNQHAYWVLNDNSVESIRVPRFSETRLYFLDINYDIPPGTWVQVELWLDELRYDPDYQYVTGFLIKNDAGFNRTLIVDQVELVLAADNP